MSQPKRWWIGLIPLGLIWGAANYVETPKIEDDLARRARQIVAAAPPELTKSEIRVQGRDVSLGGEAVQPGAAQGVVDAAQKLPGTRLVHADVAPAQRQSPYTFGAVREGQAVTLSGFVPSAEVRDRLVAGARSALPGLAVSDQLKLASGAPAAFEAMALHGVQQLAKLSKGKFGLSDVAYSLEGGAADAAGYAALAGIGSALPGGGKAGTIAITPPTVSPYTFEARHEGNVLTLSGYVPDEATRAKLLAAAQAANPGLKVEDKLAIAAGAPQGFAAMAEHAAGLAGRLADGRAALSNGSYAVTGSATDAAGYAAALAAVKALPTGAQAGKIDILAPEVKPYAFGIRKLEDGTIVLDGAIPDEATRAALLAQAKTLYPNAKIEDRSQIARTAPAGFAAAAALAMENLGKLKAGAISLADGALKIDGEATDKSAQEALGKAFAALSGFKVAIDALKPAIPEVKPYAFAIRKLEDGTIVLEGAIPDEATRAALLAQAKKLYPNAKIEDRAQIARTAPAGFAAAVGLAMENIGKLKGGAISLSDAGLKIDGEAIDKAAQDALGKAFAALSGFKVAADALKAAVPEVKPYAFAIRKLDDGSIVLEGAIPDEATRAALLAQARKLYPNAKIVDRAQIARTAPAGFAQAVALAMDNIGKLSSGAISLSDAGLKIDGEAIDKAAQDALGKAFAALPGFKVATDALKTGVPEVKPYAFGIRRMPDGAIVLEGAIPDEATRNALLALAAQLYPGAKIEDRAQIARTAPPGFAQAAALAMQHIGKLKGGSISLSDSSLSIAGDAGDKAANDAIAKAFAALGSGFRVAASSLALSDPPAAGKPEPVRQIIPRNARVAPPPTRAELRREPARPARQASVAPASPAARAACGGGEAPLASGSIRFEEGAQAVDQADVAVLEKVLAALKGCDTARVVIAGHTNSHGTRERNIALSSRRAFAASLWLQERGIPKRRIETVGYGKDRPLESEDTPEGAARNRRVEFTVR